MLLTFFLQFSDYQDSDATLRLNDSASESNITNVKISIATFSKIFKLFFTLKFEFGNGGEQKKQKVLKIFYYENFEAAYENNCTSMKYYCTSFWLLIETFSEEIKLVYTLKKV